MTAKTRTATKKTTKKTTAKTRTATKKTAKARTATGATKGMRVDVPSLFRINVEVGNLDQAADFYGKLLGLDGRKQAGSRCYFTCGPVTLQVVDVSSVGTPHPAAKALYFTVNNLDAVFARAKALGCLSREDVHGASGSAITVRPWGERSFYVEDKWQNPLCFIEAGTVYPG
jgi:catechol 2,3-dioxygenase-like lactoylglutathione lyase family enzyme